MKASWFIAFNHNNASMYIYLFTTYMRRSLFKNKRDTFPRCSNETTHSHGTKNRPISSSYFEFVISAFFSKEWRRNILAYMTIWHIRAMSYICIAFHNFNICTKYILYCNVFLNEAVHIFNIICLFRFC